VVPQIVARCYKYSIWFLSPAKPHVLSHNIRCPRLSPFAAFVAHICRCRCHAGSAVIAICDVVAEKQQVHGSKRFPIHFGLMRAWMFGRVCLELNSKILNKHLFEFFLSVFFYYLRHPVLPQLL